MKSGDKCVKKEAAEAQLSPAALRRFNKRYSVSKARRLVTALQAAIKRGRLKTVRRLVSKNVRVTPKDRQGHQALRLAAYHGQLAVMRFFMGHGASARNALHSAVSGGHVAAVKLLLSKGIPQNAVHHIDRRGLGLMDTAVLTYSVAMQRFLASRGARIMNPKRTMLLLLRQAIRRRKLLEVQALFKRGASLVGCPDCLYVAIAAGHEAILRLLLKRPDAAPFITARDPRRGTLLDWTVKRYHLEKAGRQIAHRVHKVPRHKLPRNWRYKYARSYVLLWKAGSRESPLRWKKKECGSGYYSTGSVWIRCWQMNWAHKDRPTALHWAVLAGDLRLVRRMIASGANINATMQYDTYGTPLTYTPLYFAVIKNNIKAAALLLKLRADPDLSSMLRQARCNLPMMRLLLRYKAKNRQTLRTHNKARPQFGHCPPPKREQAVLLLLRNGVDVNARRRWGQNTLLHEAMKREYTTVSYVKALLQYGADPRLKNKNRRTPMWLLKSSRNKIPLARRRQILRLLEAALQSKKLKPL